MGPPIPSGLEPLRHIGNAVEHGGLPGTVGTNDGQDLLFLHAKIDIRQGLNTAEADG